MTAPDPRTLSDLSGIGKAALGDLELLGVTSVAQLTREDGDALHARLEELTQTRQDPCVLDVLRCAVAQARDPELPREQRDWWWWSRQRKASEAR